MANIREYLNNIKNAIFGKDVRSSIHDGINAINNEVISNTTLTNNTKVRQDLLENKYDEQIRNIAASEPQSPEIVDARSGFDTLGDIISKKTYHFNSVAEMKACSKLKNGDCVQTLGGIRIGDNEGAIYQVANTHIIGIYEELNNGLYANLVNKNSISKIKPFNFNGTFNCLKGASTEVLFTFEEMQAKIDKLKRAGITRCSVNVEIKPPYSEMQEYENGTRTYQNLNFRMFPNAQTLDTYLDLLEQNNIVPYYLKFHSTWLRNDVNKTIETKMSKYHEVVLNTLPNIEHQFEYIGICNEWKEALGYSNIIQFIGALKNHGKVTFSGVRQDYITDGLLANIDAYCPHLYIPLSMFGEDTDLDFCLYKFKQSQWYNSLYEWSMRTSKPIIVGECGCPSYWDSLWNPSSWIHSDELIENGNPQYLYIKTMLQCLKGFNIIDLNYWWELYGTAIDLINNYQGGKYYE